MSEPGNSIFRSALQISAADPGHAARKVLKALSNTSIEDRKRIQGEARRQLVWDLVRLAWHQSSFHDAVTALALLAEAENETWSNIASAEFVIRFQISLGGTAVPFMHRAFAVDQARKIDSLSLERFNADGSGMSSSAPAGIHIEGLRMRHLPDAADVVAYQQLRSPPPGYRKWPACWRSWTNCLQPTGHRWSDLW